MAISHFEWVFYAHTILYHHALVIWNSVGSLGYADLQNIDMFHYAPWKKIASLIAPHLIRKVFRFGEADSFTVTNKSPPEF